MTDKGHGTDIRHGTLKLYYEDAYRMEFEAAVLDCSYSDKQKCWLVELDQSCFYPEGGGQPADEGVILAGEKEIRVKDVHEQAGRIFHYCESAIEPGTKVLGRIDWERRFDHMQQHSGEHIISGMICSRYDCDNVGFHMGHDIVVIDYNASISWEHILEIEAEANRYIWEDHALKVLWPSAEELKDLQYRSKIELVGDVRIVSFPGADMCACCGTHVNTSGQVGLLKVLSAQKIAKGTRFELVCGKRALQYLTMNWEQNRAIGVSMAASLDKTAAVYEKQKQELIDAKMKLAEMEKYYLASVAEEYAGAGDVLLIRDSLSSDSLRRLTVMIGDRCGGSCAVFAGAGREYKYALLDKSLEPKAFSEKVKALNAALNGRGGGRDGFAQGSLQAGEKEIRAFFA